MKKICKVITISKKKKVDKELIKVLLVFVIGGRFGIINSYTF